MANDATDQGSQTTGSSTTKYHQVAVPDHPLASPTTGNTFVRMGSFPATSDPAPAPASFQRSLAMASVTSASRVATGGHWSHSDGNRVTTTVGNVVDVIQGSYVAYRSAAASPPGPTLSCTWASTSYTQVGSEDTPVGWTGSAWTTPPTNPSGSSASTDNVAYATVTSALQAGTQVGSANTSSTDTTVDSNLPAAGDVVSSTWAARVLTYVGSSAQNVPYVFSQTYAGAITSNTYTTGDNTTYVQGLNIVSNTVGTSITSAQSAQAAITNTTEAPLITANQTAVLLTNLNTAGNYFTLNLNAVAYESITLTPLIANINIGIQTSVNAPEKWQFNGTENNFTAEQTKVTGLKNDIAADAAKLYATKTELSTAKTDLSADANKLYATKTELATTKTDLVATNTSIANLETRVNNDWNVLANVATTTGAMIILGP